MEILHTYFDQMFKQVKPSCEIENNLSFSPVNENLDRSQSLCNSEPNNELYNNESVELNS